MSMASVAETGGDRLCIGFELVAELIKGLWVGFALDELRECWELEIGLTVVDTGGDHCLDNH